MGRILIGSLLGGIVVFAWGFVVHVVLPLGDRSMARLEEEKSVEIVEALGDALPGSGVYLLPSTLEDDMESEGFESFAAHFEEGPTAFVAFRTDGEKPMGPKQLGSELGSGVLGALLAALILTQVRSGYFMRVLVVTLMAVFAWAAVSVPQWTWFRFTTEFTTIALVEEVGGWLLAGLLLAAFVRPTKEA